MHYVMTDVHGDYYHFMKMLDEVRFSGDDDLYIIGDVIDRGSENIEMLSFCMRYENVHLIKGNHEYFMELAGQGRLPEAQWKRYGGSKTIRQLNSMAWFEREEFNEYIESLPWYIVIDHNDIPGLKKPYLLTHTGFLRHRKESDGIPDFCYPDMTGRTVFDIERAVAWWSTYMPWDYSVSSDIYDLPEEVSFDKKLLVGHVPTISGFVFEPVPYIYQKREFIDLDCGCGYRDMDGKLACMRLEDEKIWYI